MPNQLIEIPIEKWPQLRDLYVEHKERASCYNTLQTFINWIKDEPNLPLKIYSPSEEWEVDGTYVAELKGYSQLYCNTLKEDWSDLVNALNCFDNTKTVGGVQELILPAVDKHFQDSGLKKEEFMNTCTVWYHLPREKALNFVIELPENITTKSLEERHAEQVNRIWPHRRPGSENFVKLLIRLNKSVGLFEGDKLVAWCLLRPLGALGLLQVEDSHKRRGLGQLTVKLMSKYLAENNIEVTASVVHTNETSRYMFEKLGFNVIDKVYWQFKI